MKEGHIEREQRERRGGGGGGGGASGPEQMPGGHRFVVLTAGVPGRDGCMLLSASTEERGEGGRLEGGGWEEEGEGE